MNQQRPLKDEPILSASEFEDAILGAISDGTAQGRARQLGIAILHKALQAVNPLQLAVETTTLYERTTLNDLPVSSVTVPVQLDIKQGTTRHNFNDGYHAFTFYRGRRNFGDSNPDRFYHESNFVFKDRWFATQQAGGEAIRFSGQIRVPTIWKASNTSFFAWAFQAFKTDIFKIEGHKLTLNLQTP